MRRLTIHIITVIYNRKIEEIVSLRQFERLVRHRPEVELIIADNSTVGSILEQNELAAVKRGWLRYIGCGGNIGLSRAYNLAIASIPEENPYWVMLADDDTFFPWNTWSAPAGRCTLKRHCAWKRTWAVRGESVSGCCAASC